MVAILFWQVLIFHCSLVLCRIAAPVVGKARGYLLWTDAAIPVVLLGFHNLFNILWFFQAPFILATILTYLLLAMMVRNCTVLGAPSAFLAGSCVISLALCGANGLVVAIPLIIWLLFSAGAVFAVGLPPLERADLRPLEYHRHRSLLLLFCRVNGFSCRRISSMVKGLPRCRRTAGVRRGLCRQT